MQRNAYDVKFDKDGFPTISEGNYNHLLERGFGESQIKSALDTLSREMVKKGLQAPEVLRISFKRTIR